MAKKDVTTNLDTEREEKCEQPSSDNASAARSGKENQKTVVKNAHATGLGAIGRNDQRVDRKEDFNAY